jgi:hypothetical protein
MTTQIDWEEYNVTFIYCICILEQNTHYLHFQIAQILNRVFHMYFLTGPRVEVIWNKIKAIRPPFLEGLIRRGPSDPIIRQIIELLERREPLHPSAIATYDELLNGRGALYLQLDELLGLPEGDLEGFSWRTM